MSTVIPQWNISNAPVLASLNDYTVLNNDVKMPRVGIGSWMGGVASLDAADFSDEPARALKSVKMALDAGYRAIDTAVAYSTEEACGQAFRESGLKREEVFITSKFISQEANNPAIAESVFKGTLEQMGLEFLDLYLIHWPVFFPGDEMYLQLWKVFERLYKEGLVRAIGVSNFNIEHLEKLLSDCEIIPVVNQVEFHPFLQQYELREYCAKHKIQVEAWSVQGYGRIFYNEEIKQLAAKYGKTESQITLRWALQEGVLIIPRSEKKERIIENASLYDFALSGEDMTLMCSLNTNTRFGPDPAVGPGVESNSEYLYK